MPQDARRYRRRSAQTTGLAKRRVPASGNRQSTAIRRFELLFLPGLDSIVAAEAEATLKTHVTPVPDRNDSLELTFDGRWERLTSLRTPIAVFAVLTFMVPRPKSLLSGEYMPTIVEAMARVHRLNTEHRPTSFRFEAAGADSSVFQKLGEQLAAATRLRYDAAEGDIVLRVRRSLNTDGWDVLVRLSTRPLSHRTWRVRNFPGAVNATIAAAIAIVSAPRPTDRIANPMCGSGTLMIERLLAGGARSCLGFDIDDPVLEACGENLSAAGVRDRATLIHADATGDDWTSRGPFDVILADPPWGGLVGEHRANEAIHLALLQRAREAAAPGARLVILTHEIRQMERCLRQTEDLWQIESVTRVFQKGHHPRIYLLRPK